MNRRALGFLTAVVIVLGMGAGVAGAATLYAANNGTDSAACGAAKDPCRSISQTIANAKAKDHIVVGPGRYSCDLNGNGILGEPGEEPGSVVLDKQLSLESEEGAGATIIDANGLHIPVLLIAAEGTGSVVGKLSKGFTFANGGWGLLTATQPYPLDLKLSGNIAVNNIETGFGLAGDVGSSFTVTDNLAIRNGTNGFDVSRGTGHTFDGNTAIANGFSGFFVEGVGSGHIFTNNVAIGNGNGGFRAALGAGGVTYLGNSAIGNKVGGWTFADNATATLSQNNIYGNDPVLNCGITAGGTINAANNFFGAATGPGSDPADAICLFSGGTVVSTPFATKEFPISTSWK
jgi:parallel beta helix pectate lyase-like protein